MVLRRALLAALAALVLAPGPAAAQAGDPSFTLVNRSGQAINEIYVSAVRETSWGRDLLGTDVLRDGGRFPVRLAPSVGCRLDVRVVYADNRPEERRNVDTCGIAELVFGAAPAPRDAGAQGNPSFNLVNHGSQPMRAIYVSPVRESNWGEQRLPQPLPPGRWLEIRLPLAECVNDVRIEWSDGRTEERRSLDTCRLVNLVFR